MEIKSDINSGVQRMIRSRDGEGEGRGRDGDRERERRVFRVKEEDLVYV